MLLCVSVLGGVDVVLVTPDVSTVGLVAIVLVKPWSRLLNLLMALQSVTVTFCLCLLMSSSDLMMFIKPF